MDNIDLFESIVRERLVFFRSIARRILSNRADADDALQSALLKAWRRRLFLRDQNSMAGWIARIVVNESYSILRSRKYNNETDLDSVPETAAPPAEHSEADYRRMEEAIESLPKIYRDTIHIAILGGLETKEAATMLGCSPNTLYIRIHRAKNLLREALKDE
ncbi:MAG: RNA polymerase sigma factor [Victivallales bacterium]|nr:RNA polymerase sigma factor [Victivallales bacterium]